MYRARKLFTIIILLAVIKIYVELINRHGYLKIIYVPLICRIIKTMCIENNHFFIDYK